MMKNLWNRIVAGMLILMVMVSGTACSGNNPISEEQSIEAQISQTTEAVQDEVKKEDAADPGSATGDWIAMTAAFAGDTDSKYLKKLEEYVAEQYQENGCLSDVKATEYHRTALTILALGGDPTDVSADGEQVNLIADGTWNFPGGSPGLQGSNGLIYALLTLDSKDYETEQEDLREQYINELLTYQKESGAFCIDNSLDGDVDITAMAIQALAPYQTQDIVGTAMQKALSWLEGQMTDDAMFNGSDGVSVESSAQVILALCALGEDPEKDEQFIKDDQTLLDGLYQYRMEDGMYVHEIGDGKGNIMATYQSLLALEAVQKLREEQKWIFDFAD